MFLFIFHLLSNALSQCERIRCIRCLFFLNYWYKYNHHSSLTRFYLSTTRKMKKERVVWKASHYMIASLYKPKLTFSFPGKVWFGLEENSSNPLRDNLNKYFVLVHTPLAAQSMLLVNFRHKACFLSNSGTNQEHQATWHRF